MGRKEMDYDVDGANSKLRIMNIIIVLLSVAVVLTLLFANFWTVSLTVQPGEMLNNMLEGMLGESSENSESVSMVEMLSDATADVQLKLSIVVNPDALMKAARAKTDAERIAALLKPTVDELKTQISVIMKDLIVVGARVALATVKEAFTEELGDKALDFDGVGDIIEDILSGETTVTSATDKIMDFILTQIDEMPDLDAEKKAEIKAEMEAEVESMIGGALEAIADESGVIKPEALISGVLNGVVESEGGGEALDIDSIIDELAVDLAENKTVVYIIWGFIILWLWGIAVWALLAVFALLRIFRRKKGAYLGLVRGTAWIPGFILWLLPTLTFTLLPWILTKVGSVGEDFTQPLNMFKITVMSISTIVSFAGTIVLMFLSWFGYRKNKRISKRG